MSKIVSLRLQDDRAQKLESEAKLSNRTLTDLLNERLIQGDQAAALQVQINELQAQIDELQRLYRAATNKPVPKRKRISIGVTIQEFDLIDKAAHARRISKAELLRSVLFKKADLPALEIVNA